MEQNFKLLNVSLSQESFQIKSILEIVLITLRQIFQKKKKISILYYTYTQIFLQIRIFNIKQISLETLFKYFSEPPCTYAKQKKEEREKRKITEKEDRRGEVEKWDKGRFLRSLVERQLDRGKGEPLVTGFRRYTVM